MGSGQSVLVFFFFKQKTAYEIQGDWSSDVCSSDLLPAANRKDCGKARGANPFLLDAEIAEASALRRRSSGPFCARGGGIHAFHFADSPLPGSDRPPCAPVGARKSRDSSSTCTAAG